MSSQSFNWADDVIEEAERQQQLEAAIAELHHIKDNKVVIEVVEVLAPTATKYESQITTKEAAIEPQFKKTNLSVATRENAIADEDVAIGSDEILLPTLARSADIELHETFGCTPVEILKFQQAFGFELKSKKESTTEGAAGTSGLPTDNSSISTPEEGNRIEISSQLIENNEAEEQCAAEQLPQASGGNSPTAVDTENNVDNVVRLILINEDEAKHFQSLLDNLSGSARDVKFRGLSESSYHTSGRREQPSGSKYATTLEEARSALKQIAPNFYRNANNPVIPRVVVSTPKPVGKPDWLVRQESRVMAMKKPSMSEYMKVIAPTIFPARIPPSRYAGPGAGYCRIKDALRDPSYALPTIDEGDGGYDNDNNGSSDSSTIKDRVNKREGCEIC